MKIELTEKEFEILKILIHNTNECESGCCIQEYQEDNKMNCENCDFYNNTLTNVNKIDGQGYPSTKRESILIECSNFVGSCQARI